MEPEIKEKIIYEYKGQKYESKQEVKEHIFREKIMMWVNPEKTEESYMFITAHGILNAMRDRPDELAGIMLELEKE